MNGPPHLSGLSATKVHVHLHCLLPYNWSIECLSPTLLLPVHGTLVRKNSVQWQRQIQIIGINITFVLYCDMRQDIVTDFGYRYIVFSQFEKALLQWSDVIFWTYQTLFFFFDPLSAYPQYWWLIIKKCHWVNILWNHQ